MDSTHPSKLFFLCVEGWKYDLIWMFICWRQIEYWTWTTFPGEGGLGANSGDDVVGKDTGGGVCSGVFSDKDLKWPGSLHLCPCHDNSPTLSPPLRHNVRNFNSNPAGAHLLIFAHTNRPKGCFGGIFEPPALLNSVANFCLYTIPCSQNKKIPQQQYMSSPPSLIQAGLSSTVKLSHTGSSPMEFPPSPANYACKF